MKSATPAAFGMPTDIDPYEALAAELNRSAGWVAWLEQEVLAAGPGALWDDGQVSATFSLLVRERQALARVAEVCAKVGVEASRQRAVETSAEFAAAAMRKAVTNLGLDLGDPRVKEAITDALSAAHPSGEPQADLSKLSVDELRAMHKMLAKAEA